MNLKDKNLLVISPFPSKDGRDVDGIFVKTQLEVIKDYFKEVTVIVINPVSLIPSFVYHIFRSNFRHKLIKKDYKYANVSVYFARHFYFPIFYKIPVGKEVFERLRIKAVEGIIKKYKIKFDIIHAQFTSSGHCGVYLKKKYQKPVIVTIQEDSNWFLEEYNSIDKRIYDVWKKADFLIRVNKKDVPLLREYNNNVVCIPNAFDPKKFHPIKDSRTIVNLPKDKKIILSVGMLEEYKGHKYLVAAISKIVSIRNDILCLIIGNGSLKEELQKQINYLNLDEYVKLIGGKPHDEIPLWMNACDLYIQPSLAEGNPTVMFECLGCGKPFVGTTVGGVPEIIINDKLGYLCEPKNPDKLAENILMALDRKWNEEYILNYAKKFSSDEIAKEIFKIYEKVMH